MRGIRRGLRPLQNLAQEASRVSAQNWELRLPEEVSIVGFDDIPGAAFANPGLTTVRQPLAKMGQIAAQTVVDQIEERGEYVEEIAIEPDFVVRESTGLAPDRQPRSTARDAIHLQEGHPAK